jgi:anaerobic ribonucleoside-triphosphate reductase
VLLDTQKQAKLKNVSVHKTVGENVGFERTRRITGYLVGTLDRFNNAKRAEERDRVKHTTE